MQMCKWTVHVVTAFPEMFPGPLGYSLAGKALQNGLWSLNTVNLHTFGVGPHQAIDDTPFGGGPGMVFRPDVVDNALQSLSVENETTYVYLSARGKPFKQQDARTLTQAQNIVLLCGRYEGIDQRVIDHWKFQEMTIGDFVLSGGEIGALALIDTCVRLLPGVMHTLQSADEESFSQGLLEYPQYTKPQVWQGQYVPDVLMSGHHQRIRQWRQMQAEQTTQVRRPDMWQVYSETMKKGLS